MNTLINKYGFWTTHDLLQKSISMLMLVTLVVAKPASAKISHEDVFTSSLSAYQPQLIATESQTPPTVQDVLLKVCEENGYGESCAKTLLGMLWTESSNRSTVIGDHGAARGYYQIHYKLHNISADCAEDLVCSSNWTIAYLERNSYPKYVNWAIQCHNSCGVNNGYLGKVIRYGNYFWDRPLAIDQEAPIVLAMD